MAPEARGVLQGHLEEAGVEVLTASNCKEARQVLRSCPAIHTAVVSPTLDDGSWWTIRQEIMAVHRSARIIVGLAESDGGVTDLLERGADDVLVAPFQRDAVKRIIKAAAAAGA
jgi:DNA-binding response OmpR family regulator